jgi:hypothetical protein
MFDDDIIEDKKNLDGDGGKDCAKDETGGRLGIAVKELLS